MRKIIVCGGRFYADRYHLYETLDTVCEGKEIFVIQGGSTGADMLARDWANMRGYPVAEVLPNKEFHGKSAGSKRNNWMVQLKPELVVAFPGNSGTRNMIEQAEAYGIPVLKA